MACSMPCTDSSKSVSISESFSVGPGSDGSGGAIQRMAFASVGEFSIGLVLMFFRSGFFHADSHPLVMTIEPANEQSSHCPSSKAEPAGQQQLQQGVAFDTFVGTHNFSSSALNSSDCSSFSSPSRIAILAKSENDRPSSSRKTSTIRAVSGVILKAFCSTSPKLGRPALML